MNQDTTHSPSPSAGLGLDAGGTQTRWAIAGDDGALVAEGCCGALSGLQLETAEGRAAALATLQDLARAAGPVCAAVAGVTGFESAQTPLLCALLAQALDVDSAAVRAMNDIELACHAAQGGCVVYAGTGSVAAFIDAAGVLQRVGGRGVIIDDAGGGHWIARQALCQVWRAEDEQPGAWRESLLAQAVFERVGGADWVHTRQWVYGASRGELGTLALAVATAAERGDAAALALLQQAGRELARLALALMHRYGERPLVLAGRAFDLHPAIEASLRAALPVDARLQRLTLPAHHAAAQMAAAHCQTRKTRESKP